MGPACVSCIRTWPPHREAFRSRGDPRLSPARPTAAARRGRATARRDRRTRRCEDQSIRPRSTSSSAPSRAWYRPVPGAPQRAAILGGPGLLLLAGVTVRHVLRRRTARDLEVLARPGYLRPAAAALGRSPRRAACVTHFPAIMTSGRSVTVP